MSSNDVAISVKNLAKAYTIQHNGLKSPTFRELVADKVKHPFRKPATETFWAINDISFEVKKGEIVGIVGRNGAGKSTLLKILSRIVEPTKGAVDLFGRVGSLLEVGTGFHPELTGRENIYLNGAILGMRRDEIKRQFDEIVDFAEVEKFLDTPVKRYSSGMYVRLAFAVAAHLNPEILIVDEVLAVGDATFQKKCLGKMQEVSRSGDRTVLFVSHNMGAVSRLCTSGVLLDGGRVKLQASTPRIVEEYLRSGVEVEGERIFTTPRTAYTGSPVGLRACRIRNDVGEISSTVDITRSFQVEIETVVLERVPNFRACFRLYSADGTLVFSASDQRASDWKGTDRVPGTYVSRCTVPADLLNEGRFTIGVSADEPRVRIFFLEDSVLNLRVEQTGGVAADFNETWGGLICPNLHWDIGKVSA